MCVLQSAGPHRLGMYPQVLKVSFMNLMEKCGFRNQTKVCPKSVGAFLVQGLRTTEHKSQGIFLFVSYRMITHGTLRKLQVLLARQWAEDESLRKKEKKNWCRGWEIKRRKSKTIYFFLRMSSGGVGTPAPAPSQRILSPSAPFLPRHRTAFSNLAETTRRESWWFFFFFLLTNRIFSCSTRWQHRFRACSILQGTETVRNFLTFQLFQTCSFGQFKIKGGEKSHCSNFHHLYVF